LKNAKRRLLLEAEEDKKAAKALSIKNFVASKLHLIAKFHGTDERDRRKALRLIEEAFPVTKPTRAENTQLAAIRRKAGTQGWAQIQQQEKEADELKSIKYKPADLKYRDHYVGLAQGPDGLPSVSVPFLDPAWVKHHFDEKFVALVIAHSRESNSFVPVPVGSSRLALECCPPPGSIDLHMDCHYTQGNRELCLFYSLASAVHHLGFFKESEEIRMAGHDMEHNNRVAQIEGLRKAAEASGLFGPRPIIWGQKKKRYLQFDVLKNTSADPTVVIPLGSDGGAQHAITIVGERIFDSTFDKALHLSQYSLDWCCNAPNGFKQVMFAIRFPLKKIRI
jgi:hypothetical protein